MGKKILIVDDEPDIVKIVAFRLKKCNYDVFCAFDGNEALQLINKIKPDLILLDILLPDINGYELCKTLRRSGEFKTIPIIFLTASTSESIETQTVQCCGNDYLIKPFEPEELYAKVKRLIGG